jgi:hypothetical protein
MSIFQILTIILGFLGLGTIIVAAIGICISVKQNKKQNQIRMSQLVYKINEKINNELMPAYMEYIEYKRKTSWYDYRFHGGKVERKIDPLLLYFNYLCHIYQQGIISAEYFGLFKYFIDRTVRHQDVRCYLWNLKQFANSQNDKDDTDAFIYRAL